jgi:adenine-specific DNA-methyltransferase
MNGEIDGQSLDVKAEKLEQLREVFPEFFSEGRLDLSAVREVLGNDELASPDHYELSWAGKAEARREIQKRTSATLVPDKAGSINFETADNIFIEGENLEVLRTLQKSYFGKVKLIYIDPPYNTGGDSFVYPDDFAERLEEYEKRSGTRNGGGYLNKLDLFKKNTKENGQYHSVWLSMMYPRLYLARNLLRQDGVIFVSIDDNEVANLKLLLDEIFGSENFLAQITRATGTPTGGGGATAVVNELDYLLVYSKSQGLKFTGTPLTAEESAIYDKEDENGFYLTRSLRRTGGEDRREDRPTMYYPLLAPDGTEVYPIGPGGYESRWICGKDKFEELDDAGLIEWKQNEDGEWTVYQKFYLEGRLKQPGNLWTKVEGNKKATRDVRNLFDGKKVFDFPKPVGFIAKIIQIATSGDDIVLDFFAGSGSTAHAVMDVNASDNGKRSYICVQMPELLSEDSEGYKAGYKTIADICKDRIHRVVKRFLNGEGTLSDSGRPIGVRSYKLAHSNFKQWKSDIVETKALLDQLEDFKEPLFAKPEDSFDLLTELFLKSGVPLTAKTEKLATADGVPYYIVENNLVYALDSLSPELLKAVEQATPARFITLGNLFTGEKADETMTNWRLQLQEAGIDFTLI